MLAALATPLAAQESVWELDPARTHADFTLGTTLHTVHGVFQLKRGTLRFDPVTGKASGEVVFDTTGGGSGSSGRDKNMRNSVLESAKYPEIVFRPDRIDGKIPTEGAATLQAHGIFSIHGADHEITIPVRAQMTPGQVSATMQFRIPYVQWGMRNPSTLVLRVSDTVEIQIHAVGRLTPLRT